MPYVFRRPPDIRAQRKLSPALMAAGGVVVDLAGTSALTFGEVAALTLAKNPVGASALVFGDAAAVTVAKNPVGTAALTFGEAAVLSLTKGLVGASSLIFGADGSLSVFGETLQGTAGLPLGGRARAPP